MDMHNNMNRHILHQVGGGSNSGHGGGNMHTALPSSMQNHYMMDSRQYESYPPSIMVQQPVNLMGNVDPRQMSTVNVIDLHQRVPHKLTAMPTQQTTHHQQRDLTHQIQQQMQLIEAERRHESQQQMQPAHHPHGTVQHGQSSQVQNPQNVSINHNIQQIQCKQENVSMAKSPEQRYQPQPSVQEEAPNHQETPNTLQKLVTVKREEDCSKSASNETQIVEVRSINDRALDEEMQVNDIEPVLKEVVEESEDDESAEEEEDEENNENSSSKSTVKKFKCKVCPKQFTRKNSLSAHCSRVHEEKSEGEGGAFSCSQCPKSFVDKYHLNRHTKTHDSKMFRCETCRFDFYVKREYNRHMKIHAGVKTFLCSVCSKTFTDKVKFNRHMRAHEGIKPFQCSVCSESFTQRSNLNIHLRIHDGIRPFQCTVCYICFTNKSDLNRHSRIHNGIKPFLCSMCAKCFSRKDDLNRHMKIHEGSKRYLCTMCPKCFTRKDDLNRHLRNHDGLKPFHCTVCFESFTQKALLNIHLRIHTNSKPHACTMCAESFSQQSNLHIHLKLNHGVNPFKCEQCVDETFEKETQLALHMRSVHGDKPFKCSMCEESFAKKMDMKEHLRAVHNVNPFKCDICFKCFSKKSNLRTHIRMHEPVQCDKCPDVFEKKSDLQDHVDKCHNVEDDDFDALDRPQKSFNCSQCLSVVRMPYEIKVELPFVCSTCELKANDKITAKSVKSKRKRSTAGKSKLFSCELCSKTFRYRLPLIKHCKGKHGVELDLEELDSDGDDRKSTISTVDTDRVKKETEDCLEDLDVSRQIHREPVGQFKCALCDKVFVRKSTLDRHVTVHGISRQEHDEIMGDSRILTTETLDSSNLDASLNQSLDASASEENVPEIDINKSDKENVYIVLPKHEPNCVLKEEIISDYEDNDNSMMTGIDHDDPSDSDDDVPLAYRSPSVRKDTPKKRGRPKGVPNKKRRKSEAETTDYDESAVDTDYADDESRHEESGVEGKENEESGKRRRGRRPSSGGQTEFPCPDCGKVFSRRTTLKRHIRIHVGIKEYQCWICSKCFMEKSHLNRHMRKHLDVKGAVEVEAPYSCSVCEKKFTIKGQLSRHLRAHENEKPDSPQTCEICSKSFDKKAKYKRHMKVHDGVRDHQCQVCGNRFKQKSNLNIHMKIHEGVKAHECSVCMMKFTNKSDLNRHMRKHDGVKPFLCSICAKSFSRKDDLNRHMRKHDGIKPFLCSMCAEAFSRKDHLKKHMRKCYGPASDKHRRRARKPAHQYPPREDGIPGVIAAPTHTTHATQNGPAHSSVRESPVYRAPGGVVNSVSAHAQQVLQASVGQAAASGLFWCAAQYYTNPPGIEFQPKPEYYA